MNPAQQIHKPSPAAINEKFVKDERKKHTAEKKCHETKMPISLFMQFI